jgi:hypothetical protein
MNPPVPNEPEPDIAVRLTVLCSKLIFDTSKILI